MNSMQLVKVRYNTFPLKKEPELSTKVLKIKLRCHLEVSNSKNIINVKSNFITQPVFFDNTLIQTLNYFYTKELHFSTWLTL
jgi:hypothetical protein